MSDRAEEVNESSPLLHTDDEFPSTSPNNVLGFPLRDLGVAGGCILLIALIEAGSILQETPLSHVLEDIICKSLWSRGLRASPLEEPGCGERKDVQEELALLQGFTATIGLVPGQITQNMSSSFQGGCL